MRCFIIILVLSLVPVLAPAQMADPHLTPLQMQRATALGEQFRCLVCQNETIEDSSAALALQLRQIIQQKIYSGASDQQIRRYMVQRYGVFVLLEPPVSPLTWLLYASPILALLIGGLLFYLHRRHHVPAPAPLSKAEQARLDELLK